MHDDEPGDQVHDVFTEAVFGDHPLGRQISGSVASISALTRKQIDGFYRRPLPALADGDRGGRQPRPRRGGRGGPGGVDGRPAWTAPRPPGAAPRGCRPAVGGQIVVRNRRTPSRRISCSVARGSTPRRPLRARVLNNVLGGGMSSRLFQQIREQRGLAYSVYSFTLASTATRGSSASMPAARPARSRRSSPSPGTSWPRSRRRASPTPRSSAARACSRAPSCWAWRTPGPG